MDKERDEIVKKLKIFKKNIYGEYKVEKIIFFGSRAHGRPRKHSDIDLILVSKRFKNKSIFKRSLGLHNHWPLKYPVDFLCYTPKEFEKLKSGITIVQQAVKEGIEI